MAFSIASRGAPALKVQVAKQVSARRSSAPRRGVTRAAAGAAAAAATDAPARAAAPLREASAPSAPHADALISTETIRALEAELDAGAAIAALRRFDAALLALDSSNWQQRLRPVLAELAFNLESFNPAFTAVLLRVQQTIGHSDYARRDAALARLVQPLAGEYGLHAGEPLGRTHRELFALFAEDLLREPLSDLMATSAAPVHGQRLFAEMMRDIMGEAAPEEGQVEKKSPLAAASYALGYNLAIEYLADYEKTWMLDAFRALDARVLAPAGRPLREWLFLEVHAEGEAEHAALGHAAAAALAPAAHAPLLRRAMADHDRDFAVFYNALAAMLEG